MPSKPSPKKQPFLRQTLRDGHIGFRYRSGIRTLLGLPESSEAAPSYRRGLPPVGFHYAALHGFESAQGTSNPRGVGGDFRETAVFDFKPGASSASSQGETVPVDTAAPGRAAYRPPQTAPQSSVEETLKRNIGNETHRDKSHGDTRTGLKSRPAPEPAPETPVGRTRIRIPGVSKKAQVFPVPQEDGTTPLQSSPDAPYSRGIKKTDDENAGTPKRFPTLKAEKPLSPTPHDVQTTAPEPTTPSAPRASALQHRAVSATLHPRFRASARDPAPAPAVRPRAIRPHDKTGRDFQTPATLRPAHGTPSAAEHAAAVQIAQLRQGMQALRTKASSARDQKERATQDMRQKTGTPPPPSSQRPVVIVKTAPARSATPAAFWERNHLSHLLRLRPLR